MTPEALPKYIILYVDDEPTHLELFRKDFGKSLRFLGEKLLKSKI